MKHLYTLTSLAVAAVLGLSSCSSSKNVQNSSDMYSSGNSKGSGSDYVAASPNDQYVQMKAQDPERWSYFDDYNAYDAYYAPTPYYGGGYGMGFGGFSPYYGLGYKAPFTALPLVSALDLAILTCSGTTILSGTAGITHISTIPIMAPALSMQATLLPLFTLTCGLSVPRLMPMDWPMPV